MRSIVFVDKPLLQAAASHLFVGRKGVGKGTLLAEIMARVTRGELGERCNVVWVGSGLGGDRFETAGGRSRR